MVFYYSNQNRLRQQVIKLFSLSSKPALQGDGIGVLRLELGKPPFRRASCCLVTCEGGGEAAGGRGSLLPVYFLSLCTSPSDTASPRRAGVESSFAVLSNPGTTSFVAPTPQRRQHVLPKVGGPSSCFFSTALLT